MINSFFLPIPNNKEFIRAKVTNFKRGYTFELMIGDKYHPTFNTPSFSEDRKIIIYVGLDCEEFLREYFEDFIKVELEENRDLEATIRALHVKFPNAGLYVACSKHDSRRLRKKFPFVVFLPEHYCFSR